MLHDAASYETLTRLTRLAQRRPVCGRWLTDALQDRLGLADATLDVAIETGDPIGKRLASLLDSSGDHKRLEALRVSS